jgi:replicative DNA helicase
MDDGRMPRVWSLSGLIAALEADAAALHQAHVTGQPRGPQTGLPALDRAIGGVLPAGLTILHGGPGIGKTAFALQVAAVCGYPALYVSCEMAELELFRRAIARTCGVVMERLRSGELTPAQVRELAERTANMAPLLAIADATAAPALPDWLRQVAEAQRGEADHLLIVIDSVHRWAGGALPRVTEYERIGEGLLRLQELARGLTCPILGIAERNRGSMAGGGMNASAGHREFEYRAETLLEIDREPGEAPAGPRGVACELKVTKNRNGSPGGKIRLWFNGALQEFMEDDGWRG